MSVLRPHGLYHETCAYCDTDAGNVMVGARAERLTADFVCANLDASWFRSGAWFFQPVAHACCCPLLQIRVPTASFRPDAAQRKALRRVAQIEGIVVSQAIVPPVYSDEKFALYQRYQDGVHDGRDRGEDLFRAAFCVAHVQPEIRDGIQLGSWHIEFRFNGELVGG